MIRLLLAACLLAATGIPAVAGVQAFPPSFRVQDIDTNGATIHVRVGGKGPAVVLAVDGTSTLIRPRRRWEDVLPS